MPNFSPYANFGYCSIIKEDTAGTPIIPTNFLRIVNDSIEPVFNNSAIQEIQWSRERNIRSVPWKIEISWDIEFYVETKQIGHFLRWLFWAPTTNIMTAWTSFAHLFKVSDTALTYTIDIKKADSPWIYRYFWCIISWLNFEEDENKIKCTASVMPRKAFIDAKITTSVNSWTTLALSQTSWLTTSDTILILDKDDWFITLKELTITSIDSETQLTVSTIDVQLDVKDLVVIKKSTATYDQNKVLTFLGWSQLYTGDDIDNTTAVNKESFMLNYQNEVEAKYFGWFEEVSRYPWDVLLKWYTATWQIDKFYDTQSNIDKMIQNEKFWLRVIMQGETAIESNSVVKASSVWGTTANGFKVEASTGWKAWNDFNITLIIADDDTLAATLSWNNIVVSLANTTASNNTWTLIAAVVNALSWVDGTAEWTWVEEFTTAIDNQNLWFYIWQTNVIWRDASEKPYIQFDNACSKIDPYFIGWSEDDILMEEIPLTFYKDTETLINPKKWSSKVLLVNWVSSY